MRRTRISFRAQPLDAHAEGAQLFLTATARALAFLLRDKAVACLPADTPPSGVAPARLKK